MFFCDIVENDDNTLSKFNQKISEDRKPVNKVGYAPIEIGTLYFIAFITNLIFGEKHVLRIMADSDIIF